MPGTDMPLEKLQKYHGETPCPEDFLPFWQEVLCELHGERKMTFEKISFANPFLEYYRVSITAMDHSILRAKYIRPASEEPVPLVLQFHDYPMASRSWFHLTRYGSLGYAVLAPDCRGQGGDSETGKSFKGPMAYGPMFNGLEGGVKELYLFRLFQDAFLWAETAQQMSFIDKDRLFLYGEGQGGGLALACSAMYRAFKKCAAHYPMLCDYKRIWDMDFDVNSYEGLRYYFRWRDPLHNHEDEIFRKLSYVDVKNFAPLIEAKVLLSTGLQDTVSPPSAQYAVYNGLHTEKKHLVYPKHGHELNNFFENELLKFLIEE